MGYKCSPRITQPCGAVTPRDSDTHKRIAVPKAFCVLLAYTRPRPKSGKVRRSDTRPGDVRERAERSEGSDTIPTQNATCFAVCALVCNPLSRAECVTHFHPRKQAWAVCAGGVEDRVDNVLDTLV